MTLQAVGNARPERSQRLPAQRPDFLDAERRLRDRRRIALRGAVGYVEDHVRMRRLGHKLCQFGDGDVSVRVGHIVCLPL